MNEKVKHGGAVLLADMIQYPNRNRAQHKHTDDLPRDHGLREPNERFNAYLNSNLVRDRYPNFMEIGFTSQAFVDITLSKSPENKTATKDERKVKEQLNNIENVVLVYTVFGSVDLRCKVVGIDLQDIERTTMRIRDIPGIADTSTSIILDDTDYEICREKWAKLIKNNKEAIDPRLPTTYDNTPNDIE